MKFPWAGDDDTYETVLGPGADLKGDLSVKGPVHIHGRVVGDVHCEDHLVVTKDGQVRGNLSARMISISGNVHGIVEAVERLELLATANLVGEISAPSLTIAEGAIFEGAIRMPQSDAGLVDKTLERGRKSAQVQPPLSASSDRPAAVERRTADVPAR